jgi:hypothetical protein
MTFDKFIKIAYDSLKNNGFWVAESFLDTKQYTKEPTKESRYSQYSNPMDISVTWSMGGTSGSCYDTSEDDKRIVDPDPEPSDPTEFDYILAAVCPQMGFLQYKIVLNEVMEKGSKRHGDYYGGSTTEGWKGFRMKNLYDSLVKHGAITGEQ